jgi:hypothetical protein
MGRKEKFVYNIQTLTYEKVVVPFKTKILQAFGLFSVVLVSSFALLAVLYTIFPSPREKELVREIDQMEHKYNQLGGQLEMMSKVLQNIQERDANVHRAVFGMDPIDEDIWTAGVGGHGMHHTTVAQLLAQQRPVSRSTVQHRAGGAACMVGIHPSRRDACIHAAPCSCRKPTGLCVVA